MLPDSWIDEFPEDSFKTSDLFILKKVKAYMILNMPYSDLLFVSMSSIPSCKQKWLVIQRKVDEEIPGRCLTPCEEDSGPEMIGGSLRGSPLQEQSLDPSLGTCLVV